MPRLGMPQGNYRNERVKRDKLYSRNAFRIENLELLPSLNLFNLLNSPVSVTNVICCIKVINPK